jgi:D-alanine transaminase
MAAVRDTRWLRGRMKSISLIGSVLAALDSEDAGAEDAILVRDGLVAETTSANVILALPGAGGTIELATPSLDSVPILAGVTRDLLIAHAPRHNLQIVERPIREEELSRAIEIMACGTLTMVTAIVKLDGKPVGSGTPDPMTRRLLAILLAAITG